MLPLILIIVVLVIGLVFMAWQLKKWTTELDEVNVRFDQVVAEAEHLRSVNSQLVSEKDRAFRRMRKAEQLLADYRAAGYTQFDFDALRNDYAELKQQQKRAKAERDAAVRALSELRMDLGLAEIA